MQSLLILGRQAELGLAELISLYGSDKVDRLNNQAALVDVDPCLLAFSRLGGSLKFAKVLTTLDTTNWSHVADFLVKTAPDHSMKMPSGKITIGLSDYGFNLPIKQLHATGLKLKRAIQSTGRSVRIVPNKESALSSAQVIHNKLTDERAWELLIIKAGAKTFIAQTVMVQDIAAYAARDQARPYRDARVGMLPPKLGQIIINLACGQLAETELTNICDIPAGQQQRPQLNKTILDPFCGSGVILQESWLMGYELVASDIAERMVDYSRRNLSWLANKYHNDINLENLIIGDATNTNWPAFDYVATEMNLGKPLTTTPPAAELKEMNYEISNLAHGFLVNLAKQCRPGSRICLALPAWQLPDGRFQSLGVIDQITDMGYNFVDLGNIGHEQLIYHRPGQIVGRQLIVLTKE